MLITWRMLSVSDTKDNQLNLSKHHQSSDASVCYYALDMFHKLDANSE